MASRPAITKPADLPVDPADSQSTVQIAKPCDAGYTAAANEKKKAADEAKKERLANFRVAVDIKKTTRDAEHLNRLGRYDKFDSMVYGAEDLPQPLPGTALAIPMPVLLPPHIVHNAEKKFGEEETKGVMSKCQNLTTADFETISVLGRGSFGIIHLARERKTGQQYALKQLSKARHAGKNRASVFMERDILAIARSNWIVEMYSTFQDAEYVYMVLEFLPGGDLVSLLVDAGSFTTKDTAFYMAELVEALDVVHRHGFIHRDIKPENIVVSVSGHLKLLDFGLSTTWDTETSKPVGTPHYMGPEAFKGQCTPASDIWSVGIVMFECLAGKLPFHADQAKGDDAIRIVIGQVNNWEAVLPMRLSWVRHEGLFDATAEKFLTKIICRQDLRLTLAQIRRDPFFDKIVWNQLHNTTPPERASLAASYENVAQLRPEPLPRPGTVMSRDNTLEWPGVEYDRESTDRARNRLDVNLVFRR